MAKKFIPEPQLVRGKIFSGEPAESVHLVGLVRLRVGLEVIVVAVVLARESHAEVMLSELLSLHTISRFCFQVSDRLPMGSQKLKKLTRVIMGMYLIDNLIKIILQCF